jgi:hypothetical protein
MSSLHDPQHAILSYKMQLAPSWPKGGYRLGAALVALAAWDEAAAVLQAALAMAPDSQQVKACLPC